MKFRWGSGRGCIGFFRDFAGGVKLYGSDFVILAILDKSDSRSDLLSGDDCDDFGEGVWDGFSDDSGLSDDAAGRAGGLGETSRGY